ncbi:conserved protein of unknown function (plasmid) [Cupriavidus taiwanensis]|uniref:Uncharacterized protein n=1 Tax=Cupriavidus taiwanensis TaxID=164546 RepID=A0A9Q7V244_9BURK|nr:DUF6527 family protein [Cupriavidus taiwanensis]SPD69204.1 conserved protein of unknown function [Cupriavidus taiwanensis]
MKIRTIRPEYVEHFPANLEEGVLYISEEFETAAHLCCCGCGEKVITPLNPAKWRIRKEGEAVTLLPSVGNWKYACKSHYNIIWNQVIKAGAFDAKAIESVRQRDRRDMERYVSRTNAASERQTGNNPPTSGTAPGLIRQLIDLLRKWWNT